MSVRNRPQSQPQGINYDQARALVSDRNLSQSDMNKIQDGVQKGTIRPQDYEKLKADLDNFITPQNAFRSNLKTMMTPRSEQREEIGIDGARESAQLAVRAGDERRAANDRTVQGNLNSCPYPSLKSAIPADQMQADGTLKRDSPFYQAFLKTGSEQLRGLEAAFRQTGNEPAAANAGQEANRRATAERQLSQQNAAALMDTERARRATPAQPQAQPQEVRASVLRGRNDLSAEEPQMGHNIFRVRVNDSEGRFTTVTLPSSGGLSPQELRDKAVDLARQGKNSSLQ